MRIEHKKIFDDIEIQDEIMLHGIIAGNVSVKNGGILYLHGMVTKNLLVQDGGKVFLHGMVSGDITNQGGLLEVYGTILGKLHDISGLTYIDSNANFNKSNA